MTTPHTFAAGYADKLQFEFPHYVQPARTKRSGRVWVKNLLGDACDFLQQFADGQVLGADILTLAAFQTVGCPGKALGGLPFLLQVLVHVGKQIGNGNAGRAAVLAVAAGGAGNPVLALVDGANLGDGLQFFGRQVPEVLHVA